ncbi:MULTISPECIES: BREX-2 system adenine-specific DNA-methyltransferase PglX [Sorangium]|uniref:BREX-2 system adenine-specific DNA-methyltransferase PglX n=1 Tax=Sorangium TaxID=39643 RepID=UPI003D9C4239
MNNPASLPPLADPDALVRAMSKAHRRLAEDLGKRAADPRVEPSLRDAHAADRANSRTGEPFESYRDAFCDQVAASWVLCTVFARTLEDRGYLPHRLAGPGATDRLSQFRAQFKYLGERDYLLHIFDAISQLPGGREVFGSGHAPLWRLGPTSRALGELLDELRATEGGKLRFSFGRPEGEEHDGASTRYLGDLYQNLNEDVRKRYALLQTPEFVERFILDNTLDPAIRERGIAVTVLDPACGSGHLLLGAYDRLFEARRRVEPGVSYEESARKALSQVHGIDLNPYAAAVARFRLLLSYLDKARIPRLGNVPTELWIKVYVGDALLAGLGELQATFGDVLVQRGQDIRETGFERGVFSFFDREADRLLGKARFDVVVANPPYITEKDAVKRELIRTRYKAAAGAYSLAAPFVERIFQLGNEGAFTGQITANSFMKREFGKALIADVLPSVDLTEVIDTSGAYIPGHGTPTVILFGRARRPVSPRVRVIMGSRGEPTTPEVPAEGKVWSSIAAHHGDAEYQDEYISLVHVTRKKLSTHPWSLGGGGAAELKELLEASAEKQLNDLVEAIGRSTHTGEDHAFVASAHSFERMGLAARRHIQLVEGEYVRDFSIWMGEHCFFPYDPKTAEPVAPTELRELAYVWPLRTSLRSRVDFGQTIEQRGHAWWEQSMFFPERYRRPLSIAFPFVATHNHFVLDRGGKAFNRTAPIIKLPEGATEEEHLALLGYLSSSTACFWMKQACFPKSNAGQHHHPDPSKFAYEFASANIAMTPIPVGVLCGEVAALADALTVLSNKRGALLGTTFVDDAISQVDGPHELRARISQRREHADAVREEMIVIQEELDWLIYSKLGFVNGELCASLAKLSGERCARGDRPFERLLPRVGVFRDRGEARSLDESEVRSSTRLNEHLEPLWRARVSAIQQSRELRLIESPQYKRPFRDTDANISEHRYRQQADQDACESWLLARAEATLRDRPDPRQLPVRAVAHTLQQDPKVRAVAEVLTGSSNYDLEPILADLLAKEAVAAAKCQRYTESGLEKRAVWEKTWDLQRREDAGEKVSIDIPPKYDQKDFENAAIVWRLRGKLDVPKERFIAYPTATPPPGATGKAGLVYGWAGWTHLEQLQAAIELWQEEIGLHGHELIPRATRQAREEELGAAAAATDEKLLRDAAVRDKLMPLLQTMVDLLPWVRQWHNEDGETADAFEAYVSEQARRIEVSVDDARAYRRPARSGGRGRKAAGDGPKAAASGDGQLTLELAPAGRGKKNGEASLDAAVDAVRALDQGAGVAPAALGERLGLSAAALKKTIDALVEAGRLVERKKRPRLLSCAEDGTDGAKGAES